MTWTEADVEAALTVLAAVRRQEARHREAACFVAGCPDHRPALFLAAAHGRRRHRTE